MRAVRWLIGLPHESLHVLALLMIGRRPAGMSLTHVDLPPGLSDLQVRFVALFPFAVFLVIATLGFLGMMLAADIVQAIFGALAAAFGMAGLAGTAGDWQIVTKRRGEPPR